MAVKKDPRTLELAEPFKSLFPVDPETLQLVTDSMRERGYQPDKPILAWKDAFGVRDRAVVVDGHTRVQSALDLKLREVSVTLRQFKNVDAAITAGIGEQVQRRNLNREQIAAYVVSILPLLDESRGGLRTRTAKQLAALMGVSVPTVDRARGVIASGDDELIAQVKDGRLSLLAAYTQLTGGKPPAATPSLPPATTPSTPVTSLPNFVRDELEYRATEEQDETASDDATPVEPDKAPEPRVSPETPEERLEEILWVLGEIELTFGRLRQLARGITVHANGHHGDFRIADILVREDESIYAVNRGNAQIDLDDITKVVKLPKE